MPELLDIYDWDPEKGRTERKAVLEKYADTNVKIATMHFPSPSVGYFIRRGDAFDFRYVDGTEFFGAA